MTFKETSRLATDLIDRWLDYQVYVRELPGISVGIEIGGESIFSRGYGYSNLESRSPATQSTLYRVASHSKLFTASTIMRLFAEGKVRLDDTAAEHLAWLRSDHDPNLEHITLRQLLSHSSGLNRDGTTGHWHNDMFPTLDQIKAQATAGLSTFDSLEHWKYSNMAFTILGQVIESVTGESYEDAVRRLVIEPMGLADTMPDIVDDRRADHASGYGRKLPGQPREVLEHVHARVMNSATGFSSNVEDLIKFYRHHRMGNENFLADRLKREMQRVQFVDGDYSWGLGFSVNQTGKQQYVGHSGAYPGFITNSSMCQERELIVVVLTNAIDGPAAELATGIIDILNFAAAHESRISAAEDGTDEAWLDDISGFYANRWGTVLFQRLGGSMVAIPAGIPTPSLGALFSEQDDNNHFRWVLGIQSGLFGEKTIVEKDGDRYALRDGDSLLRAFDFEY